MSRCKHPCIFCYLGAKGRAYFRGHHGYRRYFQKKRRIRSSVMKRPQPRPSAFNGHDTPCPCKLSEKYPHLWRFLADDQWEDGEARHPGSITLLCDQGWLKAALNDRDGRVTAFVTGDSLEGLLRAIDKGLEGLSLEWRAWKEGGPSRRG